MTGGQFTVVAANGAPAAWVDIDVDAIEATTIPAGYRQLSAQSAAFLLAFTNFWFDLDRYLVQGYEPDEVDRQFLLETVNRVTAELLTVVTPGGGGGDMAEALTLWHDEATVIHGNPLSRIVNASQAYDTFSYQNTAALNDEFRHNIVLDAGNFTLTMLYVANSASGIVQWYLDGVSIGSMDMIGSNEVNSILSFSFTCPSAGAHVLTGKITGTSGAGYAAFITKYWIN